MDLTGCGNVARGHVQRWTRYPHKRAEFQRVAAFLGTSRAMLPGCARCLCKDGRDSPIKKPIFSVLPLLWGRAGSRCPGALVAPAKMDALDVKNNHISRSCQHWHSGGNLVRRARPMNPGARQSPRQTRCHAPLLFPAGGPPRAGWAAPEPGISLLPRKGRVVGWVTGCHALSDRASPRSPWLRDQPLPGGNTPFRLPLPV